MGDAAAEVIVGVGFDAVVGVAVKAGVGAGVAVIVDGAVVGVGVGVLALLVKTTLGLLLLGSVIVNELVVSLRINELVPACWEIMVKLAVPFWVVME